MIANDLALGMLLILCQSLSQEDYIIIDGLKYSGLTLGVTIGSNPFSLQCRYAVGVVWYQ